MIKESGLSLDAARQRTVINSGDYFFQTMKEGETLRIVDLEGNQAADVLFFNAEDPSERYSMSDTLREQAAIYLTAGTMLKTNLNRDLLEIVADTCGRHDTLGGACATESNTVRYDLEKRGMHACRDSWMLAIGEREEFGLSKEDIGHNINFFMNVPVTPDGGLQFADGISAPGKYVELKAKMDTLILISNCPQLNNPCNAYNPTPIEVVFWSVA
jgi:urea carboxylase-associated protein 1